MYLSTHRILTSVLLGISFTVPGKVKEKKMFLVMMPHLRNGFLKGGPQRSLFGRSAQ